MARLRATAISHGPSAPFGGIEALHAVPYTEKRFLHKILGERCVANHAQNDGVGEPAIAIVQHAERFRIPSLQARHQIGVAFRGSKGQQYG